MLGNFSSMTDFLRTLLSTGYTQKNDAVSNVNKKFISHLTRAQRTPSAAATVQVSPALITILQCVHPGSHDTHPHGNQIHPRLGVVTWEINFLLTFETAPFFCIYPVYNKKCYLYYTGRNFLSSHSIIRSFPYPSLLRSRPLTEGSTLLRNSSAQNRPPGTA
jgi:hypothetical protein